MTQLEKIRSNTAGRTYEEIRPVKRKNAVLIPLVEKQGEWSILFEVRQTGIRQSGDALFDVADLQRDRDVLAKAGEIAAVIMHDDPAQISDAYSVLRTRLDAYMSKENVNLIL